MWWATGRYLASLPSFTSRDMEKRLASEMWIGKANVNEWSLCMFSAGVNHYKQQWERPRYVSAAVFRALMDAVRPLCASEDTITPSLKSTVCAVDCEQPPHICGEVVRWKYPPPGKKRRTIPIIPSHVPPVVQPALAAS
eukprot:NODE_14933_length_434_cov_8.241158_g14633_i0.p1 GENE.NODE_14933_length_434_cov_8.241158_g14633_i0~~NODE_14933_length_434_cov_8.241158_g14633_i0.p1  ORF type:complete len:139 (+),score=7.07 NODE_14933_length_434_cov_8.241158_g14633_i0:3-419(+)